MQVPVTAVVRNVPEGSRYELQDEGEMLGHLDYIRREQRIRLVHTAVDVQGRGAGSALARGALDDALGEGLHVIVECPFVLRWLGHHPEYLEAHPEQIELRDL